jgi:hypothetical protein
MFTLKSIIRYNNIITRNVFTKINKKSKPYNNFNDYCEQEWINIMTLKYTQYDENKNHALINENKSCYSYSNDYCEQEWINTISLQQTQDYNSEEKKKNKDNQVE